MNAENWRITLKCYLLLANSISIGYYYCNSNAYLILLFIITTDHYYYHLPSPSPSSSSTSFLLYIYYCISNWMNLNISECAPMNNKLGQSMCPYNVEQWCSVGYWSPFNKSHNCRTLSVYSVMIIAITSVKSTKCHVISINNQWTVVDLSLFLLRHPHSSIPFVSTFSSVM